MASEAHPAQPGALSAAGREARSQRGRGGSPGELEKMADLRAVRGCAASPTEVAPRAPRPSKRRVTFAALSPAPALLHFNSGSPGGTWYSFVPSPSPELRLLGLREAGVGGAGWSDAAAQEGTRSPLPAGFWKNGTAPGWLNLRASSPASVQCFCPRASCNTDVTRNGGVKCPRASSLFSARGPPTNYPKSLHLK